MPANSRWDLIQDLKGQNQDSQGKCKVTPRRVRVTIIVVGKLYVLHIPSVRL